MSIKIGLQLTMFPAGKEVAAVQLAADDTTTIWKAGIGPNAVQQMNSTSKGPKALGMRWT